MARIFTTDEEIHRSCVWDKVVIDDPVSLFPVSGVLVAGVVEHLIEPVLLLVEEVVDFSLFADHVLLVGVVTTQYGCYQHDCDGKENQLVHLGLIILC